MFCSLASIRSGGAVEQLLSRLLRMPFATRRSSAADQHRPARLCADWSARHVRDGRRRDQVVYSRIDAAAELALDDATDWDVATLSRCLDRTRRQRDVARRFSRILPPRLQRRCRASSARPNSGALYTPTSRGWRSSAIRPARGVRLQLGDIAPVLALGENGFSFSKAGCDPRT